MDRQLIVVAGPDKGRVFPLEDGQTLVIGRGQSSDTKINDPRMSRRHCQVQVDGGKTVLIDSGSSGGTFVNNNPVVRHALQPGDVFQAGDSQIRYQLDSVPEATTMVGQAVSPQAPPSPAAKPLKQLVGQSLAHYRLDEIIAQGNSGMVFKATDTEHERPAAIKVLTPDPSHSEEQKERFVRAMQTMMPVHHPHIVQLYNAGKNGPYCWAAMQYVDGESITDVIRRIGVDKMLDWRNAFRVALHIGRALSEAEQRKIIHRNVTPANILRRHEDKACLLGDLMLAKALEGTLSRSVTQAGQLVGDLPYMSPERTRQDAAVDHRSDIYGLGVTLYALLTGGPPFESDSLPELVSKVRNEVPPDPKKTQMAINDAFRDLVMKMIAKSPADRYQSARSLLKDLERIGQFNSLDLS